MNNLVLLESTSDARALKNIKKGKAKVVFKLKISGYLYVSIVGSVVECSPATRAARVRFPDDAVSFFLLLLTSFIVSKNTTKLFSLYQ